MTQKTDKKMSEASPVRGRPKDMEKRADILRTAGDIFMSKGYSGTTMDEIAQAANVSKLTIYNHFGTKEDLFTAVVHMKCDQFTGETLFENFDGAEPESELNAIGCAFIDLIFSPEAISMHRLMMTDGANTPELGMLFYEAGPQRLYNRFIKYLGKVEKVAPYRFPDKDKAAMLFFDLFKGDMHMRMIMNIPPFLTLPELYKTVPDQVTFFLKAHRKDV